MPSVYTHCKFACDALARLPERLAQTACENRKFYDAGQSGADLLFYYKPYKTNDVRKRGSAMHRERFDRLMDVFREKALASENFAADVAYLTGFFTHFMLDSAMHPYIWRCDEEKIAPHFVIEADYDRKLLLADGKSPYDARFLDYQQVDDEVAQTLSKYLACTPQQIKHIFRARKKFTALISSQNPLIRGFLKFLFKISSNPKGNEILIQNKANPSCSEISLRLDALYDCALDEVEKYGGEFEKFLLEDGNLGERFERDFE